MLCLTKRSEKQLVRSGVEHAALANQELLIQAAVKREGTVEQNGTKAQSKFSPGPEVSPVRLILYFKEGCLAKYERF